MRNCVALEGRRFGAGMEHPVVRRRDAFQACLRHARNSEEKYLPAAESGGLLSEVPTGPGLRLPLNSSSAFSTCRQRSGPLRDRNKPEGPSVKISMRPSLHAALLTCSLLGLGSLISGAQDAYFPDKVLGRDSWSEQLKVGWYSHELKALEEPSLFKLADNSTAESYRFLWLRTFHAPVAIRLDLMTDGTGIPTTKVANGEAGFPYTVKHVVENDSRPATRQETQAFLAQIKKVGFWSLPTHVNDQTGTDGSQWIFEGVKEGKYHVVDRWSPEKGPIRELGLNLVFDFAHMKIPKDDVY